VGVNAAIDVRNLAMRACAAAVLAIALVGFCSNADAQAPCPEMLKLRSKAAEAAKQLTGVPTSDRCDAYRRFSMTWGEIVRYANDHRELCDISGGSLSELEKRHRESIQALDAVCASRPLQPFPPEIIQR
jgi:hypothetical protein